MSASKVEASVRTAPGVASFSYRGGHGAQAGVLGPQAWQQELYLLH